jgi:hypothetical protein
MAKYAGPTDRLELYDKLVASVPGIERKGASMPYTSFNGHMFSHLSKEGVLGIRLPDDERKVFMEKYGAGPYIQFGKTMRGYVAVPNDLLERTDELKRYLELSFEYIKTLKPK